MHQRQRGDVVFTYAAEGALLLAHVLGLDLLPDRGGAFVDGLVDLLLLQSHTGNTLGGDVRFDRHTRWEPLAVDDQRLVVWPRHFDRARLRHFGLLTAVIAL